jgi:hypothetical protein
VIKQPKKTARENENCEEIGNSQPLPINKSFKLKLIKTSQSKDIG